MRLKLHMPDKRCFRTAIRVRATDLNYGNHLGNDRMLVYVQEARVEWLASMGYNELDVGGVGLIMADALIQFKGEAYLHEEIQIELALAEVQPRSFSIYYDLFTSRNAVNSPIATVKTGMVAFDYTDKKVSFIAENVLRSFHQISNSGSEQTV